MRDAIRFAALLPALTMSGADRAISRPRQVAGWCGSCGAYRRRPMMPMDVASGTELHLILETPVSSETAKPEQAVRARVASRSWWPG